MVSFSSSNEALTHCLISPKPSKGAHTKKNCTICHFFCRACQRCLTLSRNKWKKSIDNFLLYFLVYIYVCWLVCSSRGVVVVVVAVYFLCCFCGILLRSSYFSERKERMCIKYKTIIFVG